DISSGRPALSHRQLKPPRAEPLQLQLADFLRNVRQRATPAVGGIEGRRALQLAHQILQQIGRHSDRLRTAGPQVSSIPTLAGGSPGR
ncbi:MAG: hypothetical protein V3T65_02020, partial [Acidobacteriota bacterium]